MSETVYGPHATIIRSIYEMDPAVLEQFAQWVEQRGLRTPLSNVVGYDQVTTFGSYYSTNALTTTTSTAWTTTGIGATPISNLRAGTYLSFLYAELKNSTAFDCTTIGLKLNSTDPYAAGAGSHGSMGPTVVLVEGAIVGAGTLFSATSFGQFTLTGDTSTVTPQWTVSGGTGSHGNINIMLVRLGFTPGK